MVSSPSAQLLESIFGVKSQIFESPSTSRSFGRLLSALQQSNEGIQWLIDTGEMQTLESGLIHTVLSSGETFNTLVVDNGGGMERDVGLYALNYGGVYVASICPSYSYSKAVEALKEAAAFNGPSVVLLLSPLLDDSVGTLNGKQGSGTDMERVKFCKDLIESSQYSLYRYNCIEMKVDSFQLKSALNQFLLKDSNLSLMFSPIIEPKESTTGYQKLLNGLKRVSKVTEEDNTDKKRLAVLYGSDTGNSEKVAERVRLEGKRKGVFVKVIAADSYDINNLETEEHVLFVTSTAGQGEFPLNIRETVKYLHGIDSLKVPFAVFGLGDSHYWEEVKYFAKAGRDLDSRLGELGAARLTALGVGDDQDADGYTTGLDSFLPLFWESLGVDGGLVTVESELVSDEAVKAASDYLRGTITEGLVDASTGALSFYDTKLTKFHGIYQQDNRDIRAGLVERGLERAFSFMIRVRVPGGVATAEQYLAMDTIADKWTSGTIKITTRQAFQFHGVLKSVLKRTIQDINRSLLDTIAACGDVNRNVMCGLSRDSVIHEQVKALATRLSAHLSPTSGAYHEIWLDKVLVGGGEEPLYGKTYLPRKFKIAIAVPPSNDVDCLAHDLGFIAIVTEGTLVGFNVTVGGGMGQTHGNSKTFPRLADPLGFVSIGQAVQVAEKVMLVQRDFGDRKDRKHARLKYTIQDGGIEWFRGKVEELLGYSLEASRPYVFTSNSDVYGWAQQSPSTCAFTLFIQNGRIQDSQEYKLKSGLKAIASVHKGSFTLTPNQHLTISDIPNDQKSVISALLTQYKIDNSVSALRLNSMACVALPTCTLAMAESERYLPSLIDKIDVIMDGIGLRDDAITIRMTGCPNGCARPSLAEIAFIGKAMGVYNMYLGGNGGGDRLNVLYKENVDEVAILESLESLLTQYALRRREMERFGDYVVRVGVV